MALGRKAEVEGDFEGGFVGVSQQFFALFDFVLEDKLREVFTRLLLEIGREATAAAA